MLSNGRTGPSSFAKILASVALICCVVAFSIVHRHWFAMFGLFPDRGKPDVHPFDMTGIWSMLFVGVLLLAVAGVILALLFRDPLPLTERLLWGALIALAMAGVPAAVLSIFGVLYAGTLLLFLGGIALVSVIVVWRYQAWTRVAKWWVAAYPKTTAHWRMPRVMTELLLAYLQVMALVLLFHSATKPVYDYDAAIYHDAMAKILVNSHGMPLITGPSPGIEMSANYPPLFPAIGAFTLIFAGGNDLFLRLLAAFAGILASLAAYCIGRRQAGPSVGLLAASFTMTAQILPSYSTYGTVYTLMAFVAAMGFLALTSYAHERRSQYLVLCGSCLGLMLLCSYQAALYLTWIPVVGWLVLRRRDLKWTATELTKFVVPLTALGAFWYVRNWAVVGNPVYPWLRGIFGGRGLDSPLTPLAQASVTTVAHDVTFGFGQTATLLNLLRVTFLDRSLFPVLSPLAVIGFFAAVALTTRASAERITVWLLIPCAVLPVLLFEATGTLFLRYFIPLLPILALLPAYAFYWLARRDAAPEAQHHQPAVAARLSQRGAAAFASVILAFILIFPGSLVALSGQFYHEGFDFQPGRHYLAGWHVINPNPYSFNAVADDPGYEAFPWMQQHLQTEQRVATYESRLYYLFDADWKRIMFLDGSEVGPIWNQSDPNAVARYLQSNNVQYVWLSRIVQVGADRLPLTRMMVGNTPLFPIVRQWSDAFVYRAGEPLRLGIGESSEVSMNNEGAWSGIKVIDGAPARAVLPTSVGREEPPGVLVQNGDRSGYLAFDYQEAGPDSTLALDLWTGRKPTSWDRLLTLQGGGSGEWHSGLAKISGHQLYGTTRLAFRPLDRPIYIRNIRFVPEDANAASVLK